VFSTHSAAKFCRVTPMTIIRWIDEGRIKAYKTPGGHRRIMRADLEDFCRRSNIPMEWEEHAADDGTVRVLVIDDEPEAADAILDALVDEAEAGAKGAWKLEHTDNAFDGGRLLASFRPHIVFLDLELPGVDIERVAESIRTDPATQGSRLVGIAADRALQQVDVDAVIARPIAAREVKRATGPLPDLSKLRR
ncbi:MAG: excisionase family DNA-binding protein, partial [Myxococcales bacterium]|nr:excisionase family DNA-binding protein [Myxococcales bacterium]